eukprot:snap_masked-scaffold628_size122696-processed-gene-0.5 protein:Tk01146 transcript:snap_masked-scaffold628_size122696-processed-gene-0.5-mRNA-1 annotation:"structural maintenance of chromosomes protein 4"
MDTTESEEPELRELGELGEVPDLELRRDADGGLHLGPDVYIPPPPPPALTFEADRPRLVITHIENENFKSYAGRQVLGPFHKSFTSIVGPNGSGKSNVIDSMLFVFGYRAQKIRSKKISVLIHESEKHPHLNSCTVRVFFKEILDVPAGSVDERPDPDDVQGGAQTVPESGFSVARTAFKDNTSFYEINGQRVAFKEVAMLLRARGIDLDHNRFLILQGEVEQIALMKPKGQNEHDTGMLEFLEDIIGSSRFQKPIEMLKSAVAQLDEMRAEKLNRVKLVEKEKDELEGPKNQAMEFLRLENDLIEKKNLGYQQYVHTGEKKLAQTEAAQEAYETNAREVLSQVDQIATQRAEKEKEQSQALKDLDQDQKQWEEIKERFKAHELDDAKIREEMKTINVKRKKLLHLSKTEKEKYEKLKTIPEINQEKIVECHELKDKLMAQTESEQEKYDQAVTTLNAETQEYQLEKETHETRLIDLKKDLNEKDSNLKLVQNELAILNSKEAKERAKLDQFELNLDQTSHKLKASQTQQHDISEKIPDLEKQLGSTESQLKKISLNQNETLSNVRRLQGMFEEKRATHQAHRSRGKVHDALMQQKQCGQIPGIFGRLGDLGAIDKKFDVAISTATGNSLDNILVDNVNTAKLCIEYLRKNNIGRANFLALDKTARWEKVLNANFEAPEGVPRLIDLVQAREPRFQTAFYQYVRDTLVATTMDQAQRIAFGAKRYRVVTLGGEVIETSGAMSGGGREVMRGKMGSQNVAAPTEGPDLTTLEADLRQAEAHQQEFVQHKTDHEDRIAVLKREIQALTNQNHKLQLEIKSLAEKEKNLKSQIGSQAKVVAQIKPDEAKLSQLTEEETKLQSLFDASNEKCREVEIKVQNLNKKIKEIAGGKLKAITKKLDETRAQLDKVKSEITRLEVGIKTSDRDLKKSKDRYDGYDIEVAESEDRLRTMKSQRDELEEVSKSVLNQMNELKKTVDEKTESVEEQAALIDKLRKAENKFKSQQIEINQHREKFRDEIKEHTRHIAHWRREIKKLKLREIPGENLGQLQVYTGEALDELDMNKWTLECDCLEEKLSSQKANYAVIEDYRRKEAIYLERVGELDHITKQRDKQRKCHEDLRKMRLNEFMEGFSIITAKLKEMYQMITLGGDAELELVDSLDPFTEGIVFSVRPPKKSWKNISNLSGGEKTLSSLALVFALHYYKPTPLYVMDEIDAALDFKNVSIVANYIRERTKNAQFIIISLRSNMFELADRLVGIYKTYNCTKSVTINPGLIAGPGAEGSTTVLSTTSQRVPATQEVAATTS